MKETAILVRNPFPVPDLKKEGRWFDGRPILDVQVDPHDRRWYADLEPHRRLFSHQTLSSSRKNWHYRTCSKQPRDFLDLSLTSVYEHHKDLFLPKSYCYIQPETINKETWRVLRNRVKMQSNQLMPKGREIIYSDGGKKCGMGLRKRIHPCSFQLATEGPHNDRTNPGFSRKIDGSYYGI